MPIITHECPPDDSGLTPCCHLSPFELPLTDRLTLDHKLVTCTGSIGVPTPEYPNLTSKEPS